MHHTVVARKSKASNILLVGKEPAYAGSLLFFANALNACT